MDFLDPKKQRAHEQRLFIGYALVGLVILISVYLIVMQAYGFGLDRKTGAVVQNGMLFVDAQPAGADVYLNGENKGRTDKRLVMTEGEYDLELANTGYRTWKRSFLLEGGKVLRFVYPLLFPEKLESSDASLYASVPTLASQSPDRRWLVLQQPGDITAFEVVDLSNPETTPSTIQKIPQSIITMTGSNHVLTAMEWSTDNRHVLLRHNFDGGFEYIVFDREAPNASFNVNQVFKDVPMTEVVLRDKKVDQLYLLDGTTGTLRLGVVSSKQTEVYVNNVLAFKPHGEKELLYVTNAEAPAGKILVRLRQGDETFTLRELTSDSQYLLEIARFSGDWFVAAGATTEGKVYIYKNPQAYLKRTKDKPLTPIYVLKGNTPNSLSFSANTRFIALQSGSEFNVYDAEVDRGYRYNTNLNIPSGKKATWMDGHRLMIITNDVVNIFDYDGTNQQNLVNAYSSFVPFFDRDYKNLYTLSPSVLVKDKPALLLTSLVVKQN